MSAPLPIMGPVLGGTLVSARFDDTVAAYCNFLDMRVAADTPVSTAQAALWAAPALRGARCKLLSSASGAAWIRVVEDLEAPLPPAFRQRGWMALEVVVEDVDALHRALQDSPFEIFRPPADLDVSPDIRAMQVIGPVGEVLYLTQVKAPVPPFEIPQARCAVDRLFIPVMSCVDRDAALAFYRQLCAPREFVFDTRITSVNAAFGWELERRHPVATVQLAGESMIEIDQIPDAAPRPHPQGRLPAGVALVSFAVSSLAGNGDQADWLAPPQAIDDAFYQGARAGVLRGAGGELIELVERPL